MNKFCEDHILSAHSYVIKNAHVVTPSEVIKNGSIRIENGLIVDICERSSYSSEIYLDARGQYLLPGFIDIHGDSLERAIAPRPAAPFPPDRILPAYDAELTVHGITTMYHCVALADLGEIAKPLRRREQALEIIQALRRFAPQSRVRTRIHLRYEILDMESLPLLQKIVEKREIDLLSLMDHTPGYGVFKDIEAYRTYRARSGSDIESTENTIIETLRLRELVDESALDALVALCHRYNIVVASHDDHTEEKISRAKANGIGIAEFPVTWEAVKTARNMELYTVFGAANLVRGGSHAENLCAAEMVTKGIADILCSDYSPMSLLQGLFRAASISKKPFHEIVKLFTLNPACAVGLENRFGSIEPGKTADLILVDIQDDIPKVTRTIVDGRSVFVTH